MIGKGAHVKHDGESRVTPSDVVGELDGVDDYPDGPTHEKCVAFCVYFVEIFILTDQNVPVNLRRPNGEQLFMILKGHLPVDRNHADIVSRRDATSRTKC